MAEGKRQWTRQMVAPPMRGVSIGPRSLLPVPANENRAPARLRAARIFLLIACAAALIWSVRNLLVLPG